MYRVSSNKNNIFGYMFKLSKIECSSLQAFVTIIGGISKIFSTRLIKEGSMNFWITNPQMVHFLATASHLRYEFNLK